MRVIHKQLLDDVYSNYNETIVNLPKFSKILKLEIDPRDYNVYIWYMFDQHNENLLEQRKFLRVGTGWDISDDNSEYISTVFQDRFIWHYFEERA